MSATVFFCFEPGKIGRGEEYCEIISDFGD